MILFRVNEVRHGIPIPHFANEGYCMSFPIILVSPARPENVGAAARAMKTMGFKELRIINSLVHQDEAAYRLAHGAGDILDHAQCYDTLEQALSDVDFSIATTARSRARFRYYATPENALRIVSEKQQWLKRIALVFGCEESGLTNQQLQQVDLLSGISMAQDYPSLNLGQSVMVYCYQFSALMLNPITKRQAVDEGQLQALRHRVDALLSTLNVDHDIKLSDWLSQRIGLAEQRDTAMLHQLIHDIEKKLSE